jgi:hypothetical protein
MLFSLFVNVRASCERNNDTTIEGNVNLIQIGVLAPLAAPLTTTVCIVMNTHGVHCMASPHIHSILLLNLVSMKKSTLNHRLH